MTDVCFEFPRPILDRKLHEMRMFADEQVVMADVENTMQRALYDLYKIKSTYNLKIYIEETKVIIFVGKPPVKSKFVLENQVVEQVGKFNFL